MFYYLSSELGSLPAFLHGILKGQPKHRTRTNAIKACSYPNDQMGFVFMKFPTLALRPVLSPPAVFMQTLTHAHIHTDHVHTEDRELRYQ